MNWKHTLSVLLLLQAATAFGQLFVTNNAPFKIYVSIGYLERSDGNWYSKGWYAVSPGETANIFNRDLSYNRYYYYYAKDSDGNYWSGGDNCSTCENFLIDLENEFSANRSKTYSGTQLKWKKFGRIDAGGYPQYTLKLTAENWCDGNCQNGYGTYKWVADSKKYTGNWVNGLRSGRGTCTYGKYHSAYAGCKFEGEWRNNTWYEGTFTWPDGSSFTGKWVDEKKSGYGVLQWADGSKYEGSWSDDKRNGFGKMYYAGQDKTYSGNWVNDKREGMGSSSYGSRHSTFPNCSFEGTWENNTWKKGTLIYKDGAKYVGEFSDIKKNGKGTLYDRYGNVYKSGDWVNDVLIRSDDTKPLVTWDSPVDNEVLVASNNYTIRACVYSQTNLQSVKVYVNGQVFKDRGFTVDANCTLTVEASVPLSPGINSVYVVATNTDGTTQSDTKRIRYSSKSQPVSTSGRYHALLIAIDNYKNVGLADLDNPIADATRLRDVLLKNYRFDPGNLTLMRNPGKQEIVTKIQALQNTLKADDYLLLFFAGHGKMQGKEGYWLAADASPGNVYNWLSSSELNGYLKSFNSRHILLISDACYSGAFLMRDAEDISPNSEQLACEVLEARPSRCAMTSGAKTTVPDKSTFIEYLVKRLSENTKSCLSAEALYFSLKTAVISNSPNNQIPQFGSIPQTGHEGGGFIFYKK